MVHVIFRNLEPSAFARTLVKDRLSHTIERFPDLQESRINVTLSMENSPQQAGPDLFRVRIRMAGGRYNGVILQKTASNLFVALAAADDSLLERLNRFSDRVRVKKRQQARRYRQPEDNQSAEEGVTA